MAASPEPKVLLVEDDPEDQRLVLEALARLPETVPAECFPDGAELLLYFEQQEESSAPPIRPLVLLDLHMPLMDGRSLINLLRSNPARRRIPVVVLTTSNSPDDVCLAFDMGANAFITKPAFFEELVETVESLVSFWFHCAQIPPYPQRLPASQRSVLAIVAEPDEYMLLADILHHGNGRRFHVDWARSYESGLRALMRDEHDLYLVEDGLAGPRSGLDLIQTARERGSQAPLVLVSSEIDGETLSGVTARVGKEELADGSVDRPRLVELLMELLKPSRAAQPDEDATC